MENDARPQMVRWLAAARLQETVRQTDSARFAGVGILASVSQAKVKNG